MVKHPRYQIMDQAREDEIQKAFAEVCGDIELYELKKLLPKRPRNPLEMRAGPIPRPTFHVFNTRTQEKVAHNVRRTQSYS